MTSNLKPWGDSCLPWLTIHSGIFCPNENSIEKGPNRQKPLLQRRQQLCLQVTTAIRKQEGKKWKWACVEVSPGERPRLSKPLSNDRWPRQSLKSLDPLLPEGTSFLLLLQPDLFWHRNLSLALSDTGNYAARICWLLQPISQEGGGCSVCWSFRQSSYPDGLIPGMVEMNHCISNS